MRYISKAHECTHTNTHKGAHSDTHEGSRPIIYIELILAGNLRIYNCLLVLQLAIAGSYWFLDDAGWQRQRKGIWHQQFHQMCNLSWSGVKTLRRKCGHSNSTYPSWIGNEKMEHLFSYTQDIMLTNLMLKTILLLYSTRTYLLKLVNMPSILQIQCLELFFTDFLRFNGVSNPLNQKTVESMMCL